MDFAGRIVVQRKGRNGRVAVCLGDDHFSFYWEFGGGNCIATVDVPDTREWGELEPYRRYPRASFLAGLAQEIARLECPLAGIEIGERGIYFLEPSRSSA